MLGGKIFATTLPILKFWLKLSGDPSTFPFPLPRLPALASDIFNSRAEIIPIPYCVAKDLACPTKICSRNSMKTSCGNFLTFP